MSRFRPNRRTFGHGYLAHASSARFPGICRVCDKTIAIGEMKLARPWGVEVAHVACGWLRADERAPHEVRGAELTRRLFEWACTACGRDVVANSMPAAADDLRCTACRTKERPTLGP